MMVRSILFFLSLTVWSGCCFGLTYNFPKPGDHLVGEVKKALVREDEDFADVAERYDVGFQNLAEANPKIDPENPVAGLKIVVPTKFLLPKELQPDLILINLASMRLYYVPKNGRQVYIFSVGIGQEGWNTPLGEMKVVSKIVDPTWVVPESIFKYRKAKGDPVPRKIPPGPDDPLGSYALRLSIPEILIHGTNEPSGVGRRSSAGCIRMYPQDIEQLFHMVSVGTRVVIINRPYLTAWSGGKLYLEAHLPLFEQRQEVGEDVTPALEAVEAAAKGRAITVDWSKVANIARQHSVVPVAIGSEAVKKVVTEAVTKVAPVITEIKNPVPVEIDLY